MKQKNDESAKLMHEKTQNDVSDNESTEEPKRKKLKKAEDGEDEINTADADKSKCDTVETNQIENKNLQTTLVVEEPFVHVDCLNAVAGDLIEIARGLYSHWGVYTDDKMLIHVTGPNNDISVTEAHVRKMRLCEVAGRTIDLVILLNKVNATTTREPQVLKAQ